MSIIWIADELPTARRAYRVYERGLYVGTMLLTIAQVREFTAKADYILKPSYRR
jgi:hypothetical protein